MPGSAAAPELNADTKVLVADDDLEILRLLTRHLATKGVRPWETSDGEEALRLIDLHRPDLVVLDVMMPGMTGWEICRSIREDPELKATGVLMLTGIGESLNEMTSPLYGADAYLDKPFDFDDLDAKLLEVLRAYQER